MKSPFRALRIPLALALGATMVHAAPGPGRSHGPEPAAADRLVEVVPVGHGFLARRADGTVFVVDRFGPQGTPLSPFRLPESASPLVSDADTAWASAPTWRGWGPSLWELRIASPRDRKRHELPAESLVDGVPPHPVGVDMEAVYLSDGTRFVRRSRAVVAGHLDRWPGWQVAASLSLEVTIPMGEWQPVRELVSWHLLREGTGRAPRWAVARTPGGGSGPTGLELPPAAEARLADATVAGVVVVLDGRRALRLDPTTLELVGDREVAGGLISAHAASLEPLRRAADDSWVHVPASDDCPAGLVLSRADGDRRMLPLPEGARLVPGALRLAVWAPDRGADRVVLIQRSPHGGDYALEVQPLRTRGERFVRNLGGGVVGGVLAVTAIAWVPVVLAVEEEWHGPDADELQREHARQRAKQRAKVLPRVVDALAPLPDPGPCGAVP